jgi:hypothetical protein
MFINIFEFEDDEIRLNKPEVLLYPEFDRLYNDFDFLKCKEDKSGKNRIKAWNVFKYIWLAHDFRSDYMELPEAMRIEYATLDSGLSKEDIANTMVISAIAKYEKIQNTRLIKMLKTAQSTLDKVDDFLNKIDLFEKDSKDAYVHKTKDLMSQIAQIGDVAAGVKDLEFQIKREMESKTAIKGDAEEGYMD